MPKAFFNVGRPAPAAKPVAKVAAARAATPTVPNTPAEIGRIMPGMKVSHAKFGLGKVLGVEGTGESRKAAVFFEGVGQKQLVLKFAKLTIVEE